MSYFILEKQARYNRHAGWIEDSDCDRCGGIIDTAGQVIKSPGNETKAGFKYSRELDCRWLIEFDVLSEIRLTVVSFELETGTYIDEKPCP